MDRMCMFSTAFWEDAWISNLDATEKYFYIYLFTNPRSNIIGLFPLPERRICFDTGLGSETVKTLLNKFQDDYKKIHYDHEWIFVKNKIKFQNLNNSKIKKGILNLFNSINSDRFKTAFMDNLIELNYNSLAESIINDSNYQYKPSRDIDESYMSHQETSMTDDDLSMTNDESCMRLEEYNKNINKNIIKKQQQVVVKSDDSSGDDSSVVVDFSEDEKHEFPPLPAKQKHFEKITHSFQIIREMAENKISPELILSIYNKNPILDLTRWWLWAKIKSKSNVPGFFLTLVNKAADEMPKDVAEQIKQEFLEIDQREKLIAERKRRVS